MSTHPDSRSSPEPVCTHPAKVQVIRPGVDLRRFRPRPAGRPPGPARILFVGGDFVRKGGDDLLEAVRYLGDSAELDLVTASAPPSLPGSPRIRVHVGLDHNSEQLFDLYRRADVFVLPSRGECYGHVICEALASGLPVVACDVGAVRGERHRSSDYTLGGDQ